MKDIFDLAMEKRVELTPNTIALYCYIDKIFKGKTETIDIELMLLMTGVKKNSFKTALYKLEGTGVFSITNVTKGQLKVNYPKR